MVYLPGARYIRSKREVCSAPRHYSDESRDTTGVLDGGRTLGGRGDEIAASRD